MNNGSRPSAWRCAGVAAILTVAMGAAQADGPALGDRSDAPSTGLDRFNQFSVQSFDLPLFADGPQAFSAQVSLDGVAVNIDLVPHSNRSATFEVWIQDETGYHVVDAPPVTTYKGEIRGVPGSHVRASLFEGRLHASISIDADTTWYVEPLAGFMPDAAETAHLVYHPDNLTPSEHTCGADGSFQIGPPPDPSFPGGGIASLGDEVCEIACDADTEFYAKNGNSLTATLADIENILNEVEFIYERDVDITYEVTTIIVRTSSPDPYSSFIADNMLCEFRETWNSFPESTIARDVAHLFTGKNLSGTTIGLAYNGVICNESGFSCGANGSVAYGLSESRFNGASFNERIALTAHELGHNWNAPHCSGFACNIMCAGLGGCGGINGANLKFNTSSKNVIINFRNTRFCLEDDVNSVGPPFFEDFESGSLEPVQWSWVRGATISGNADNEPSPSNAVLLDSGFGEFGDDEIRTNKIRLGGESDYVVEYWVQPRNTEAGDSLLVYYWDNGEEWNLLNEYVSDGSEPEEFEFFSHPLPGDAYHDEFRVRFLTDVDSSADDFYIDDVRVGPSGPTPENDDCENAQIVADGDHPFSTLNSSTDGVLLPGTCDEGTGLGIARDVWFIYTPTCEGDVTVSTCGQADYNTRIAVYIDIGACPPTSVLVACSDDADGCAGGTSEAVFSAIPDVPYFIRVGGPSVDDSGTGTLTISCDGGVEPDPCPADFDDDGMVGASDLAGLLSVWGTDDETADLDDDGVVGPSDLAALLSAWGGCPE